jgi:iron complex outermembrane recepter protein
VPTRTIPAAYRMRSWRIPRSRRWRSRRRALVWNASVFRTANTDDIMFISSGPRTNTGHFENVGDTLRQGIELGASGALGALRWGAGYSFLRARFNSPLTLSSPHHPAGQDGEILVVSGSRLPTIPQHNLKVHASAAIKRLTIGGTLLSTSNQYLRGDEANLLAEIRGFSLVNVTATCAITKQVALTGRVTNLLGSEHATFGLLGNADDVLGPGYENPRFLSPGAPRAGWVGVVFSVR